MDRLTVRLRILGSSAKIILSAPKVRGVANGGNAEIGIKLGGTKAITDVVVPKGNAPPERDPGAGLPGGINESVISGRLGLMAMTTAEMANARTRAPIVSLTKVSSSFLVVVSEELDEELEESDEVVVVVVEAA